VHYFGARYAKPLYMFLHMALFVLSGALSVLLWWRFEVAHTLFLVRPRPPLSFLIRCAAFGVTLSALWLVWLLADGDGELVGLEWGQLLHGTRPSSSDPNSSLHICLFYGFDCSGLLLEAL
jgi:hypothetical protein